MAGTNYYIACSFKSRWTYWDGSKFAQHLTSARRYDDKATIDKVRASLQKLSPGMTLKIEEVVTP